MPTVNWAEVAAGGYAVPAGVNPAEHVPELLARLGDPDPTVRDAQAYGALATWVKRGHLDEVLPDLGDRCAANLQDENVLRRSFNALILGECLGRSRRAALLDTPAVTRWYDAWRAWYPIEADTRSYDDTQGWIHTVAHGADVAAEWARRDLTGAELLVLIDILRERLRTLTEYLNQTEDDRLALALFSAFSNPNFGPDELESWSARYRTLWTELQPGKIPPGAVLAVRTLHSLHTLLCLGATINGEVLQASHPTEALEAVQDALKSVYPYYGQASSSV